MHLSLFSVRSIETLFIVNTNVIIHTHILKLDRYDLIIEEFIIEDFLCVHMCRHTYTYECR